MKTDWGVVLAALIAGVVGFFLGAIVAHVFPFGDSKLLTELITATVGAFVGTSAGAWIALHGDRKRRAQEREDRNVAAANAAILQLARVSSYLVQYRRDVIAPDRTSDFRWFLMARKKLEAGDGIQVDLATLAFLFVSPDPNVPSEVGIEFDRFKQILGSIKEVKQLLEEAHARMERAGITEAMTQQIEAACGVRIKAQMKTLTDSIVDHVDRSAVSVVETARRVHAATRAMYPDSRVISFESTSPPAAPATSR